MKAYRFVLAAMLLAAAACQELIPESATDPLPFPIDAKKDLSVNPGDDFFMYCNGTWFADTPKPASGSVGSLYDMFPAMEEYVNKLVAEDPSLKRFFQLKDEMWAHEQESLEYMRRIVAEIPEPKTTEEGFRTVGRLIAEGLSPIGIEFVPRNVDGTLVGVLGTIAGTKLFSFSQIPPAAQTQLKWLVEGMQLDPATIFYDENTVFMFSVIAGADLNTLGEMTAVGLMRLYPYVSEALLNAHNVQNPTATKTKADAETDARICINYELSHRLAQKYIPATLKQHYQEMTRRMHEAFRERMKSVDWMSETTQAAALDKLDKMKMFVGCPDQWYQDCLPDLSGCKSLVEAVHTLKRCQFTLYKHLVGTDDFFSFNITQKMMDSDGKITPTDLTLVNAQYYPKFNSIFIFPASLLPPVARTGISEAHEYGRMAIIAHELTHGFDSNGANYDGEGDLHNWWTVADRMSFEDRCEKLVRCFNTIEFDREGHPGEHVDGKRTLSENIADLGGLLISRDAYVKRLEELGFNGENYAAQMRKFYESYADFFCMKYSDEKLDQIIKNDIHSPCRVRVNGIVMNSDMWYDLYGVNRNNILYLPPERRAYIW